MNILYALWGLLKVLFWLLVGGTAAFVMFARVAYDFLVSYGKGGSNHAD